MNTINPLNTVLELACIGRDRTPSPLGLVVLQLLAVVFRGLHHIDMRQLKKTEWENDHHIAIDFSHCSWATTDFNELTQLVVLAHDACVRLCISSPSMRTLRLLFHARRADGSYAQRQETLEKTAEDIRKQYTVTQ